MVLFTIQITVYRRYSPFCTSKADGSMPGEALISPIIAAPAQPVVVVD